MTLERWNSAALDFNGTDLVCGGFDGHLIRYHDAGGGVTTDSAAYNGEMFWGEYRVYGQLLRDPQGNSVLISGTNSNTDLDPTFTARVVAIDVTRSKLLWEFDTGVIQNHGFTVRGGPLAGPDGKVYYFEAVTGELVAIKPPARPPPQDLFIRGDANCSGRVDLSDAVFIFNFLFLGGSGPCCDEVANSNDDQNLTDITDGIVILNHLFLGASSLPPPFPECGEDPDMASCPNNKACNGG